MALLIGDILAVAADQRPGAVAATLGSASVRFAELDAAANRAAHALQRLGVGAGDVVAWWSGPSLRVLEAMMGAARIGAVFSPLSPLLAPGEAATVIDYLQPRLLVAEGRWAETAATMGGEVPLAGVGGDGPGQRFDQLMAGAGSGPAAAPAALNDADPHVIYLTSGTTGRPKGVVVSHRASWLRSFPGGGTFSLGLHGDGGILTSFPLFHYGGWHYVLEAWHNRCAIHLTARADAEHMLAAIEQWRPTGMYSIPAVWRRLLDPGRLSVDLGCVRHADTGTSATPPALIELIRSHLPGATTSVFYGSTEGGHHTTLADWDVDARPGSVGRSAPPGLIRLDPDGEIRYRSHTLMSGYYRMPEESAEALEDGWYRTGDLGHLDDDGYLYVTGRKREVIRTGGETVAPAEVEAALSGFPGLAEVAVVGLADHRWGEVVCAVVVMDPGHPEPGTAALRQHLAGRLASFKHPRRVVAVAALPRTAATGQLQRSLLRENLALRAERDDD